MFEWLIRLNKCRRFLKGSVERQSNSKEMQWNHKKVAVPLKLYRVAFPRFDASSSTCGGGTQGHIYIQRPPQRNKRPQQAATSRGRRKEEKNSASEKNSAGRPASVAVCRCWRFTRLSDGVRRRPIRPSKNTWMRRGAAGKRLKTLGADPVPEVEDVLGGSPRGALDLLVPEDLACKRCKKGTVLEQESLPFPAVLPAWQESC